MIQYRIYKNNSLGGPIDYTTPVATVSSLTYTPAAILVSSDVTYAIRAFDTVSGLEEQNIVAQYHIVTDASGADVTNTPRAPTGLTARPGASGQAVLTWLFLPIGPTAAPTGFHVYLGSPAVSYASSAASVAYTKGLTRYSVTLTGLTPSLAYQFGLRAYNASGEETNTSTYSLTLPSAPPLAPDSGGSEAVVGSPAPTGAPPLPPS